MSTDRLPSPNNSLLDAIQRISVNWKSTFIEYKDFQSLQQQQKKTMLNHSAFSNRNEEKKNRNKSIDCYKKCNKMEKTNNNGMSDNTYRTYHLCVVDSFKSKVGTF